MEGVVWRGTYPCGVEVQATSSYGSVHNKMGELGAILEWKVDPIPIARSGSTLVVEKQQCKWMAVLWV